MDNAHVIKDCEIGQSIYKWVLSMNCINGAYWRIFDTDARLPRDAI